MFDKIYVNPFELSDEIAQVAHDLEWLDGVMENAAIFETSVNEQIAKKINQKLDEAYGIIELL